MRLAGLSTVVTGSGSGLGAAVAELFAAEGALVTIGDINVEAAESVAHSIIEAGGRAVATFADISSSEGASGLIHTAVERFGGLDVLVNNAGVASAGGVTEVVEDDWDRVMDVNLKGAYLCSRAAIPHLRRAGGGAIVCVSSASGVIGQRGQVAYNVSKHGVIGLVRCMALDHAEDGIRVNAVCPGVMRTPMLDALSEEQLADLRAMHPMGRMAEPSEVARLVLHLACEESSFTTGAVFLCDGGLTAG